MEITNELLKKVQDIELEILKEVVRVCNEHGIRYYLDGGTCLGAIRHGGFIPWDDDIDIAMPREDYEKFKKIFPSVCNSKYFLHSRENDKHYSSPFLKVRKNNTVFGSESDRKLMHMGVWIDIFCIDLVSMDRMKEAGQYKRIKDIFSALYANKLLAVNKRNLKWKVLCAIIPSTLVKYIEKVVDKHYLRIVKKGEGKKTFICFNTVGTLEKAIYSQETLFPVKEAKFCDMIAKVPNDCDAYLTTLYGNWRKLPPENQRVSNHDISYIEL